MLESGDPVGQDNGGTAMHDSGYPAMQKRGLPAVQDSCRQAVQDSGDPVRQENVQLCNGGKEVRRTSSPEWRAE